MGEVLIGTSGWSYDHWEGILYPKGLSSQKRLSYYMKEFDTVEVNYSFYRIPTEKSVLRWRESSPEDFTFALKANRGITHLNKSPDYLSYLFVKRARLLEAKLGPILFQFPPTFERNEENISKLLKLIPRGIRAAVEFRNEEWHKEETFQLLKERAIAYCIISAPDFDPHFRATSHFAYLRLHGSKSWYSSSYPNAELTRFAKEIQSFVEDGLDVFVYFNNDHRGFAVSNALKLKKILKP